MAERRMFTKKVTDSDAFIELSSPAQALYFHLNQGADDDGFNNQIQNAMFKAHASLDDLRMLMLKSFLIRFESGVIVITHWRMHNTLRKDRYTPTNFQEEFRLLGLKENGTYALSEDKNKERLPAGCQTVAKRLPQGRRGKDRIGEVSIGKDSKEEEEEYTHACEQIPPPSTSAPILLPISKTESIPLDDYFTAQLSELYPDVDIMAQVKEIQCKLVATGYPHKTQAALQKYVFSWFRNLRPEEKRGATSKPTRQESSDVLDNLIAKYESEENHNGD